MEHYSSSNSNELSCGLTVTCQACWLCTAHSHAHSSRFRSSAQESNLDRHQSNCTWALDKQNSLTPAQVAVLCLHSSSEIHEETVIKAFPPFIPHCRSSVFCSLSFPSEFINSYQIQCVGYWGGAALMESPHQHQGQPFITFILGPIPAKTNSIFLSFILPNFNALFSNLLLCYLFSFHPFIHPSIHNASIHASL